MFQVYRVILHNSRIISVEIFNDSKIPELLLFSVKFVICKIVLIYQASSSFKVFYREYYPQLYLIFMKKIKI